MGTRERDQTTPHQPLLSSLVVRPTDSGGGSDYEPGEVRGSDRFSDKPGYRIRAGSGSPEHHRNADRRYSPDFDTLSGIPRGRGYGSGRSPGRYRHYSPPNGRGRGGGGRLMDRRFDGPGFGPGPFKGEGLRRNNANVRPREGDWICPDPLCKNLNFARRHHCKNCNRFRYAPEGSPPRRGYLVPPPPHAPPRRFPGPPMDRSPVRIMNGGYRSPPPRGRARDGPREFDAGGPQHARYEGRFLDHHMRRDRSDYLAEDFRDRSKFDRPMPPDLGNRDRGRDSFFNERKGYERQLPSPPLPPPIPPPRGQWLHDSRERSRSPIRGGPPLPPKDYRRDMYMEWGRDERRGMGRNRTGDAY